MLKVKILKELSCSPIFSDHIDKFSYILINPSVLKLHEIRGINIILSLHDTKFLTDDCIIIFYKVM
jgi:hypothetical protein